LQTLTNYSDDTGVSRNKKKKKKKKKTVRGQKML